MDGEGRSLPLAGVRVLLVHHYEALCWLRANLLRKKGAEVFEAAKGTDGLGILDAANVDVAILDCGLLDMPAAQVRSRMREKPAVAAVPVIYIAESEADQPPLDGQAFLREPLDLDKLASIILWVLGRATSSAGP